MSFAFASFLAASVVGAVPAGAAEPATRCPVGSEELLLARGAEVIVTQRASRGDAEPQRVTMACDRRNGRRTRIDDYRATDSEYAVQPVHVAGRYVAYVTRTFQACSQCGPGSATVHLVNARTGRERTVGPTTGSRRSASGVGALVSDAAGRVAWISFSVDENAGTPRPITSAFVRKVDAAGPGGLSEARDLYIDSLRLSRGVLTWREGGVTRSRRLR